MSSANKFDDIVEAICIVFPDGSTRFVPSDSDAVKESVDDWFKCNPSYKRRGITMGCVSVRMPRKDYARRVRREMADVESMLRRSINALRPFAAMDRADVDLDEIALTRGTSSDMTIITSGDFRRASDVLDGIGDV